MAADKKLPASSSLSSRRRTQRAHRGSQQISIAGIGGVQNQNDSLAASSMTSVTSNSSGPFANGNDNNRGDNKPVSADVITSTSLSSLSSMFDDEEMWAEFKTELKASQIKTGAGVQGMLSKFIADKSKQQQQQEQAEEESIQLPASLSRRTSYGSALILEKMASALGGGGGEGKVERTNDLWTGMDRRTSVKETYNDVIRGDVESVTSGFNFFDEHEDNKIDLEPSKFDADSSRGNRLGMLLGTTLAPKSNHHRGIRSGDSSDRRDSSKRRETNRIGLSQSDRGIDMGQSERKGSDKDERLSRSYTSAVGSHDVKRDEKDPEKDTSDAAVAQPNRAPFWLFGLRGGNKKQTSPEPKAKDSSDDTGLTASLSETASSSADRKCRELPPAAVAVGSLDEAPSFGPPNPLDRPPRSRSGLQNGHQDDNNGGSRSESYDHAQNTQDGSAQDVNIIRNTPPSSVPSTQSCLKSKYSNPSSKFVHDPSTLSQTSIPNKKNGNNGGGGDTGQGAMHLLRLLLSLDNGPSEERANSRSSSRSSSAHSSAGNLSVNGGNSKNEVRVEEKKEEQRELNKPKPTQQAQQPEAPSFLGPSRSAESLSQSADTNAINIGNNTNSLFKYRPRRKHAAAASVPAATNPPTNRAAPPSRAQSCAANKAKDMMRAGSAQDVQRRHVPTVGDNVGANQGWSMSSASPTSSAQGCSNGDNPSLERHMHSMMSTGSIRDIKKRHIPMNLAHPVANRGEENQSNGNQNWSKIPNPLMNMSNNTTGNGNTQHPHFRMNSIISTGSTNDARKRHIPTTAQRLNQDCWGGGVSAGAGGMTKMALKSATKIHQEKLASLGYNARSQGDMASMNQKPSADALKSQMASMVSTGSIRDLRKRHVMTTQERQNQQDWDFEKNANNDENVGREVVVGDQSVISGMDGTVNPMMHCRMSSTDAVSGNRDTMNEKSAGVALHGQHRPQEQHAVYGQQAQELPKQDEAQALKQNGVNNTGRTDLFRRYIENKTKGVSSNLLSSSNGETTTTPKTDLAKDGSRGGSSAVSWGGELLVDWGDSATEDDDISQPDKHPAEDHPETQPNHPSDHPEKQMVDEDAPRRLAAQLGRYVPKKKERRHQQSSMEHHQRDNNDPMSSIDWACSKNMVEERCITVDRNEAALHRLSDLTTAFDPDDEDETGVPVVEEEPAPLALRRRMRSLSIAEGAEEEEEEEERDKNSWQMPGAIGGESNHDTLHNNTAPPAPIAEECHEEAEPIREEEEEGDGGFFFFMGSPDNDVEINPNKDFATKTFQLPVLHEDDDGKAKRGMSFKMGEDLIRNMSRETLHEDEESEEEDIVFC